MSNEEREKVKNLIEQCMVHYLNKNEVVDILNQQQKIDPSLTRTVWERLEQQNLEFFKGYYLRVILKEQITEFNYLLEKQAALMNQMNIDAGSSPVESTGSANSPGMQSDCDFPMNTLAQNPNVGMLQGKDGLAFNSASGYLDSSKFGYEASDKLLEAQQFGHLDSSRFVYEAPGNLLEAHQFGHLDSSRFAYEAPGNLLEVPGNLLEAHQFATPLDYSFNTLPLTYNDQQSTSGAGVQSAFDFPMNTLAQNPNVGMLQGTSGLAFHSNSGYLDNLRFVFEAPGDMLEAHQFGTPPDYGFCPPLPLVSNDQQSTSGTGQNMNSTAQDFWPRFEEQSQRLCKWLMSNGQWKP